MDVRKRLRLLGDDRGFGGKLFRIGSFLAGIEHAEYRIADLQIIDAAA